MLLKELLDLSNLFGTQVFSNYKVTKIVIICKNKDLVFATFKIVLPYFKIPKNSQKLAVIGLVLSFSKNLFSKKNTIRYH